MAEEPDLEHANAARMYDYFLGGAHHFAVDREHAARLLESFPDSQRLARANRSFLRRVVAWSVEHGIDQFLDLGSGVPTVGNVHEIARRAVPDARVAYVDVEPVAVAHAEQLLADVDGVTATRADLADPAAVLAAPGVSGLLDFSRPVALLAVSVLHFVAGDLRAVLDAYRAVLAPGSVVAVSIVSDDQDDPELAEGVRALARAFGGSASTVTLRSRAEVRRVLEGLEDVPPGLVPINAWPAPQADTSAGFYGIVARVTA